MGWKKFSSRTVYENDWMAVREDHVRNPGGGENQYGYVHFKNIAVAILPLDNEDHTWLVGQSRYTLGEYSWELPMGGAPRDEAPVTAAQRELAEETGLRANDWQELMRLHTSNSITDEQAIVFVATDLAMGNTALEESEDISTRRLHIDTAIEMAARGEITDAISVAALLRVGLMRRGES
ncbi:MAG: NUDIX hydrolase [Gammaproteobacteria bacterium]|nr:NUDIX hydrolase [Gammaproteobacteria bacterium]